MENPRPEKVEVVAEVKERLESASSVVVTEYRGLTVHQLQELRSELRKSGGRYKVYKNTLVRRAADEAGIDLNEHLTGPTALAFAEPTGDEERGDVVGLAKALRDFAKTNPELVIKGGLFNGESIDASGINALADVEPREVLLAKLAGLMAAPLQQFAGLLQAVPRDFAYGLQALIDEGGAPGAPAAAEASPEPAAEPAADAAEDTETTEAADGEAEAASDTETPDAGEEE